MVRLLPGLALLLSGTALAAQMPDSGQVSDSAQTQALGRRIFQDNCVRCHGIGGRGGTGAVLARAQLVHASDDSALVGVIRDGIPGTAMQAQWHLSDADQRLVAGYVRLLGRVPPESLSGDPVRGEALFHGDAGCLRCHVVAGWGGSLGPELSAVGARRGAAYLRLALRDPAAAQPPEDPFSRWYVTGYLPYLVVEVQPRVGPAIRGVRVNEDAFSIQLRDADGRFHSVLKSTLRRVNRRPQESLMPSYAWLDDAALEDLVAYLASLRGLP